MTDQETSTKKLAMKYLELGGTRRAKLDDNIADVRKWDDEPAEADEFWKTQIEPLEGIWPLFAKVPYTTPPFPR